MTGRVLLLLCSASFATAALVPIGQDHTPKPDAHQVAAAGAMFKQRCASCHLPPDTRFKVDRAWVEQIRETAWTDTPAGARAALIKFFEANQTGLPEVASSRLVEKTNGFVSPSFETGAVLVQDEAGKIVRLSWEDGSPKGRLRALPAGKYSVRGYRLIRKDKAGKEWFVSASSHDIKEFTVQAAKETLLKLDEAILLRTGLKARSGKLDVMMEFQGENRSGLTIYAAGKRIPVGYRVVNAAGEELAKGSMTYGWGGGAWASCKPVTAANDATLKLDFEEPPFPIRREPMKH